VGSGHSRKPGDQPDGSSKSTGDQSDGSSSESSRHRKKPGEGHGGPGGEHGDGQGGGHGSGKGGNSSTASTTTIKNFDEEEALASAAEVTTDNSGSSQHYEDGNIKITYTQYTTNDTTIHVADVQLSSAEYLKTAFADNTYGKNVTQTTSDIAAANNAVLAINGDYYGVQEKGYVIRNGVLYREAAADNDVLCIYGDGSMKVVDPSSVTAQELLDQGVWQAFSFGPGLLEDGSIPISLDTEVGRAKASNPRTAIGIIDDLHYVFVVSDGRSDESEGLSLYELAVFMQELGAKTAYNLDGGGSSTMYFNGNVVNNPTSGFRDDERKVSDIIYIG
jgi:exopolysaccharide biosynthesis protein